MRHDNSRAAVLQEVTRRTRAAAQGRSIPEQERICQAALSELSEISHEPDALALLQGYSDDTPVPPGILSRDMGLRRGEEPTAERPRSKHLSRSEPYTTDRKEREVREAQGAGRSSAPLPANHPSAHRMLQRDQLPPAPARAARTPAATDRDRDKLLGLLAEGGRFVADRKSFVIMTDSAQRHAREYFASNDVTLATFFYELKRYTCEEFYKNFEFACGVAAHQFEHGVNQKVADKNGREWTIGLTKRGDRIGVNHAVFEGYRNS